MTMTATRPHATGAPGYSETWPCEPKSAQRARSLVRAALNTWGLEVLLDDGALIISELVGNTVRHSGCRVFRASVMLMSSERVRLAVSDKSTVLPQIQQAPQGSVTGRGLLVVDELADRWNTDIQPWGKIVWAELRVRGA